MTWVDGTILFLTFIFCLLVLSLVVRHGALYALGLGLSVIANLAFGAISMKVDSAFRGYPGVSYS